MLFILEGLDATGKTTLARNITAHIKKVHPHDQVIYMHKKAPKPGATWASEYGRPITEWYAPGDGRHLILDRFHLGELVWPHIFERPMLFDDESFDAVDTLIRRCGGIVIYCFRDHELIQQTMRDRGEEVFSLEQLKKIELLFHGALQRSCLPYYYTSIEEPTSIAKLVDHAYAHEFPTAKKRISA